MTGEVDFALAEAAELYRAFARIEAEVARLSRQIAGEILAEPPRQSPRIAADRLRITHLVRQFAPLSQRIVAAQAAASARAREAGIPGGRLPPAWYDLATRAHLFRNALNRWAAVQGLIDAQQPPRRRPLYHEATGEDIVAAQADATDALLKALHAVLNPLAQGEAARLRGAHADIALPHSRLVAHCHAAFRVLLARGVTEAEFLDVGCGIGTTLLTGSAFFARATGIELDPGYARAGSALLAAAGRRNCRIIEIDAAAFPDYRHYDVVLLFRPMRDEAGMRQIEEIVTRQLRPGTVVVAPYRGFAARHAALGCAWVEGGLYLAGSTAEVAAGLRELAEHMGAFFGRRPPDLHDVWEPILAASAARGFGLRPAAWADNV